jgi:hypothetical protein
VARAKTDDSVFESAKKKLGEAIEACKPEDVVNLVRLCETLSKMKAVELKADEGDYGEKL